MRFLAVFLLLAAAACPPEVFSQTRRAGEPVRSENGARRVEPAGSELSLPADVRLETDDFVDDPRIQIDVSAGLEPHRTTREVAASVLEDHLGAQAPAGPRDTPPSTGPTADPGGSAILRPGAPKLILPSRSLGGWADLDVFWNGVPAAASAEGGFVDPNARFFDAIRSLRLSDDGSHALPAPSAESKAALDAARKLYLAEPVRDHERAFAEAIAASLGKRGVPAVVEKYVHDGWPHFFAVILPAGGGHWLVKTANLLSGLGGKLAVAPEFVKDDAPSGLNLPGWGVLLEPEEAETDKISPTAQHEVGHFLMGVGARRDAEQSEPGAPYSRVSIAASSERRFEFDPAVVPERILSALKAAFAGGPRPDEVLVAGARGNGDVLDTMIRDLGDAYGQELGLEETWTHRISAQGDLDIARFDDARHAKLALYGAVQGWIITGAVEKLLLEALAGPAWTAAEPAGAHGDRVVGLGGGARLSLHSAQIVRGRPAAEKGAPIARADYEAVFRQSLAETLADRRALAEIAEQAIALLDRR